MENLFGITGCNGECVVNFGAAGSRNVMRKKVKFAFGVENMENEAGETLGVPTHPVNEPTTTSPMRLKEGVHLILNNIYWSAVLEMIRDGLFWCVEKVGVLLLHRIIFLLMKQQVQLQFSGKIDCKEKRTVPPEQQNSAGDNSTARASGKFHEMFRHHQLRYIPPPPQADLEVGAVGECSIPPEDVARYHFREVPEEEDGMGFLEQRLRRRVPGRYEDLMREPERDVIQTQNESFGFIPQVFSQEFTRDPEGYGEIEFEENPMNMLPSMNVDRATSPRNSVDASVQMPSKRNTNSVDWYFRRNRSRQRGRK